MNLKKGLILLLLITCLFISISAIGAADDSNQLANDTGDVLNVAEEDNLEIADNEILSAEDDGSFYALKYKIENGGSEIELENDYVLNESKDQAIINYIGIDIRKTLTIDGKGHSIDAKGQTNIFNVYSKTTLKNIIFVNGESEWGGAIYSESTLTLINCSFINNSNPDSNKFGGAISAYGGSLNVTNTTFINNHAYKGGAVYAKCTSTFDKCIFLNNTATEKGSIIQALNSIKFNNSIFINNLGQNIIDTTGSAIVNNSWFGNTVKNKDEPNVDSSYVTILNQLVLDLQLTDTTATVSLNNLYDGGVLNNYDLPPIEFDVKAVNIESPNKISLGKTGKSTIEFESTPAYSVTIRYNTVELKNAILPTFKTLKDQIDNLDGEELSLNLDYCYDSDKDNELTNGIVFSKNLTIDGQGHIIDAKGLKNIFYFNDDSDSKNLTLKNIIFTNAFGTNGSAIYFKGNRIQIINCTFLNNTADNGDAVYIANAQSSENQITKSTFINNIGDNSVVYVNLDSDDAKLDINNSIFLNSTASNTIKGNGNIVADYNWWGNTAEDYNTRVPNVDGATLTNWIFLNITADIDSNITTVSLNNLYDGNVVRVYENYALPSITLTIKGTNATVQKSTVTLDNYGKSTTTFKLLKPDAVLTASYEDIEANYVIHYVIVDDGSFKELYDIIRFSSENDVIELTHDYSYSDSDTITSGIQITKTLTIIGNGSTIDAKGKCGIFLLYSPNVVFKNITFKNGVFQNGGAIYCSPKAEFLTVENCNFINNTATNTDGGAIYSASYNLGSVVNSTFINNRAVKEGAAIVTFSYSEENAVIDNCWFINNTAPNTVVYAYYLFNLHDCIFLNNVGEKIISGKYSYLGTLGNNWFGNTFDNYKNRPQISMNNYKWLYLDIKFYEDYAIVSLNNLYSTSGIRSEATNYNLPKLTLNINSTTLNLDTNNVTLDSNGMAIVPYTMIGDEGALTVSFMDISLTKQRIFGFEFLKYLIDEAEDNSVINLTRNYTFLDGVDLILEGIVIDKNLTIDGKGFTIDASNKARIFDVKASNVTFKNINFVNAYSGYGSAIRLEMANAEPIEFNVINCTFINNTAAYSANNTAAAIKIDAKEGNYNIIDSKFENNTASTGSTYGGAIHINVENAKFYVNNCSFTGNVARNAGAIGIVSKNTESSINYTTFIKNKAYDGKSIYFKDSNGGNLLVNNSIFLDNSGNWEIYNLEGSVVADYNWWGNIDGERQYNYPTYLNAFKNGMPNNWVFINATGVPSSIYVNETLAITLYYLLYNPNTHEITEFDYNRLPMLNFTLSCEFGNLTKDGVFVNEEFGYTATEAGYENISVDCCGVEYPIEFNNRATSEITLLNDTIILYYGDEPLLSNFANLSHAGKLTYSSSNTTAVGITTGTNPRFVKKFADGEAVITVSYAGSSLYDPAEAQFTVKVVKAPLIINITNYSGNELTLNVDDSFNLTVELVIDLQGQSYHYGYQKIGFSSVYAYYPNNYNIYDSHHIIDVIKPSDGYSGNVTINAISGGNITLTLCLNDDLQSQSFNAQNATINITVNRLKTEVSINEPDTDSLSLKVEEPYTMSCSVNVTDASVYYYSSNSSIVSVGETTGTLNPLANGTAVITVEYKGNGRYENSSKTLTVTVSKYETTTAVTSGKDLSLKVEGQSQVEANLSSQDPSFTGNLNYTSSNESVATVDSNGLITAVGEGIAIITVKYDGTYKYADSSDTIIVNVSKTESSITLNTENPLTINVFNQSQIDAVLDHVGNLSYASSNPDIVSVDENGKITAYAGGIVNITISYAGNDTYAKAEDVNLTVIVNKLQSHINVEKNTFSIDVDANDTIVASMEGRALRFVSNDPNVVGVNETTGKITGITGGTANVTVIFDEDGQYLGDEVNVTVTVNKLQSSLTVENPEITIDVDGSALIDVRTNSDGELEFISGNVTIVSLNANNVTGLAGGKVNVTVRVKESGRYLANETNVTVTVNKLQSTISVENPSLTIAIDETVAIIVSSNNDDLSYTTDSTIISIEGNVVKGISNGTCVVTVTANENGRYLANNTTVTVAVNKISSVISVNENATFAIGDSSNLNAALNHAGTLNYTSTNESVITVDENGNIKAIKEGEAQILITFNETEKYLPTSATVNVTVTKKDVPGETAVTISVPDASRSPTLTISLPNAKGNFSVIVDGKQYGPVSLVNGTASITVPELEYGEHNITVLYSGDDNYAPINYKTSASIKKPVLSKNKNINMRYSGAAKYTVRVTVNGKAIAGQYVTFKFNGKTKNIKTDKNGYATFKIPTVKPKKTAYKITATFKGVTVKNNVKVNSIIKAKNLKVKKSKKVVKIKVSLKKVNGKYLKGKKLKLKIKGKTLKAKTNKKGKAVFKLKKNVLKKLKVGKKYRYKVIYGKDVVTKKIKVKR
ncbi:Ig-like domain-containing protein [Methanobrevibacter sp.]